jgi:gluconolactonase
VDGPHLICEGPAVAEGPVWCPGPGDDDGTVVFTSVGEGAVSRVHPASGVVEPVADTGGGANGAARAADGGFLVTQNGGIDFSLFGAMFDPLPPPPRFVPSGLQYVAPGGAVSYLADGITQAPNDLCVTADGTIFFTDPAGWPPPEHRAGRVLALSPDGDLRVAAAGFWSPNGIALDLDGETLIVVENGRGVDAGFVRLRPDGAREPFADGRIGDGCALDVDGRIYMAGGGHLVTVYEPDGTPVEELRLSDAPVPATNCCFGGPDLRTLFVTAAASPGTVHAFTGMPSAGLPLHLWPGPT